MIKSLKILSVVMLGIGLACNPNVSIFRCINERYLGVNQGEFISLESALIHTKIIENNRFNNIKLLVTSISRDPHVREEVAEKLNLINSNLLNLSDISLFEYCCKDSSGARICPVVNNMVESGIQLEKIVELMEIIGEKEWKDNKAVRELVYHYFYFYFIQ